MTFPLYRSERAEELAFLLSQLDSGSLTLMDLTHCRRVIHGAVEELRRVESLIQSAQTTMRDELAKVAMQGLHAFCASTLEADYSDESLERVAKISYRQASAMLAVRAAWREK